MHKFNPIHKAKLDNPWRREVLPPTETLIKLGLREGDMVADIGCGIGYFSIPAAKLLKESNLVYALDILEEMLLDVEIRKNEEKLSNIKTILNGEYDLVLPDHSVSFVLLGSVFHEIEDKDRFLKEVRRILTHEGRIAIIDWKKVQMDMGPPLEERFGEEDLIEFLQGHDMKIEIHEDFKNAFYGIVARG